MILLKLFFEFFKVGLFSVGGGLATVPFLQSMGMATGWFTDADLTTMIAVAESTPGPIGVNMATYVGYEAAGIAGSVIATLGLVTPSILVILIIAGFLQKFRTSKTVNDVFYGLRPASTALVAAAGLRVAASIYVSITGVGWNRVSVNWLALAIGVAVFAAMRIKKLSKLHPIVFIALAAVVGMILKL